MPLVDVAAAYTRRRRLGVDVGLLHTTTKQPVSFEASVPGSPSPPDPNQTYPVSDVYFAAEHGETQLHF